MKSYLGATKMCLPREDSKVFVGTRTASWTLQPTATLASIIARTLTATMTVRSGNQGPNPTCVIPWSICSAYRHADEQAATRSVGQQPPIDPLPGCPHPRPHIRGEVRQIQTNGREPTSRPHQRCEPDLATVAPHTHPTHTPHTRASSHRDRGKQVARRHLPWGRPRLCQGDPPAATRLVREREDGLDS